MSEMVERVARACEKYLHNRADLAAPINYDDLARAALDAIPYAAMREALEGLVKRLEEINQHPSFGGIWPFLHVHNYNYDGPNWAEPLDKARAALRAADGEEATNEQRGP